MLVNVFVIVYTTVDIEDQVTSAKHENNFIVKQFEHGNHVVRNSLYAYA